MFSTMTRAFVATLALTACWLAFACPRAHGVAYTWNAASGNWDVAGNWTPAGGPPGTGVGDTGTISSDTATANAQLSNAPDIFVDGTGVLIINALGTSATGGTITIDSGGRLQWTGTSTGTTTISLLDGSTFGKGVSNALAVSSDTMSIASGATVTASQINSTVTRSTLGLRLTGALSTGDATSKLVVNPISAGFLGPLVLEPSSANTGFIGDVELVEGPSSTTATLVLSGTGALSNVDAITIGSGTQLRFLNATDPLPSAYALTVPSGGRVEWEKTTSVFNVTPPTITLQDGATIGREEDQNALGVSNANLTIAAGATATASRINATVTRSTLGLQLSGALSSGDADSKLVINPTTAGYIGSLMIAPTSANTGFIGDVELVEGPSSSVATLVLGGTGALSNVDALTINSGTILRFRNATDPLPSAYAITVPNGGRVEWEGATSVFSVTPPTITLQDGATIGREEDHNALGVGRANLSIDAGATVTASRINASVARSTLGLQLSGALSSGDASSKLVINPTTADYLGPLMLAPTSANTGFIGDVELVEGPSSSVATLVLGGTGALSNVDTLTIGSGTILRFRNATDPLPSGYAITVPDGGRVEWEGTSPVYNVTPPTITFQDGSEMGRHEDSNQRGVSKDNIVIAPGATVTVSRILGTIARTDLGLTLQGTLDGSANSTLIVQGGSSMYGPLLLTSSSANPFAGTVRVTGVDAAQQGSLVLSGTGPLANAKLLDIQEFGTAVVFAAGAADDIGEIAVHNGGTFRLRNNSGSTLANTTLSGDGRVRSELVDSTSASLVLVDQSLRSLSLNDVIVSPGFSTGTLTVQATQLSLGPGTTLAIELGGLGQDLLDVEGDLVLDATSELQLDLADGLLTSG